MTTPNLKHFLLTFLFILFLTSCSDESHSIPGYIEGEYTYVASGVSGTLFQLNVKRGQDVMKGEELYLLDPQPEKDNVEIAKANIANLESQVAFAKVQLQRQQSLYQRRVTSKADLDRAQTDFDSASQQLSANRSQLNQMNWSLRQKSLSAPVNGKVFDTFYRVGEKVQENHPVLAILAPENIKVLFYVPEAKLSQLKLGEKVTFTCDGCAAETKATISYISPEAEYTPPIIYSKDTRHKLVYLIRADLPQEVAKEFHPGQPVDVYLPK